MGADWLGQETAGGGTRANGGDVATRTGMAAGREEEQRHDNLSAGQIRGAQALGQERRMFAFHRRRGERADLVPEDFSY